MLIDIATEELSHLEVIGTIVAMLNKDAKSRLSEAVESEAEMYKNISGHGNSSHVTQVLYGGGPAYINSGGQLWNAGYIDTIGDPSADLRSNIAAESRAKIVYERLIAVTDDPGVKDALGFLMTREIAHQQSFEKALYSIQPNFPPGKLAGKAEFTNVYFNMSVGDGDARGPWNNEPTFDFRDATTAVDGGSGMPEVTMDKSDLKVAEKTATRLQSDLTVDPVTGTMLGMGGLDANGVAATGAAASPGMAPQAAKENALMQAEAGTKEPPLAPATKVNA